MIIALTIALTAILGFGLYELLNALTNGGSSVGRKQVRNLEKWNSNNSSMYNMPPFKQIVELISDYVQLDENKRKRLELDLSRARLSYTPEQYTVTLYLGLGVCCVIALIFTLIKLYFFTVFFVIFGVYFWSAQNDLLRYNLKMKDKEIAKELPSFVISMKNSLEGDRDIIRCVERYNRVAGETLRPELEVFLIEAKSGNFDAAVTHFAKRLNSEHAFNLATILMQINRGVDQQSALDYLGHEMQSMQNQRIEAELAARPGKMQKAVMPVMISGMIMVFATMGIEVYKQISVIF